jgi:hypothetical protein
MHRAAATWAPKYVDRGDEGAGARPRVEVSLCSELFERERHGIPAKA